MDIVFVRHGQTVENSHGKYGSTDTPLSEKGREQISALKGALKDKTFRNIYLSPLKRTIETAEILGLDGLREERIKEINFGIFEGKSYQEINEEYPLETFLWVKDYIGYRIPEGESLMDLYNRVSAFLEEVIKNDTDVLVITHEGVIRCALCWVFDNVEYFYKFKVSNGRITVVTVNEGYKYIKI